MTAVICRACGWASWPVSRAYAERSVARFNAYLAAADDETRAVYGGRGASLDSYTCIRCGGTAFRPELPEDRIPDGVTLNPVVCDEHADYAPGQEQ